MLTAGYNSILQLSEDLLNKTFAAFYAANASKFSFTGRSASVGQLPNIKLVLTYDIRLTPPSISLLENRTAVLNVHSGLTGNLKLCVETESAWGAAPAERCLVDVTADAEFDCQIGLLSIQKEQNAYLVASFSALTGFVFKLNNQQIPKKYGELISKLLSRVLIIELRSKIAEIPLTSMFKNTSVGGWPVTEAALRVLNVPSRCICLALQTEPNAGSGSASRLKNLVDPADFCVALNEAFLIQTLDLQWRRGQIPTRFDTNGSPNATGAVRLKTFSFSVRAGLFHAKVNAIYETPFGNQEVWIHGSVGVEYEDSRFKVQFKDLSIEVPWAVHLLGFIVFRGLYVLVAGVLAEAVGSAIGDLGASLLNAFLNGGEFDLLYQGQLPGTNLTLNAALVKLRIDDDGVVSTGKIQISGMPLGDKNEQQ